MKHAERLDYLNDVATTVPEPIFVGTSLIEMLKQDEQNEETHINAFAKLLVGMTEPLTQPGTSQVE